MNPRYRVPALASAGSRLCLVYDVRSSPLDLPGPHGIAVQHSLDAGATWIDPRWLREPRPDGTWGCGDPSLIPRLA